MGSNAATRWLFATTLVVALVGALDAAIGRSWDLVALFGLIAVLALVALGRDVVQRSSIDLRPDLVRALRDRARLTGEPTEQLADRAVATYLWVLDPDDGSGARSASEDGTPPP